MLNDEVDAVLGPPLTAWRELAEHLERPAVVAPRELGEYVVVYPER